MSGRPSVWLTGQHEVTEFTCGKESLDHWLKTQALRAQQSDTARTYVWTAAQTPRVVAYYSIAPTQIVREGLTSGQAGGLSVVPAYLLARLALDRSLHGKGLGSELLVEALLMIVRAAQTGSGRLIVVDAIDDEAMAFYRHHDFQPVKGNERRLIMKVATARQALGVTTMRLTSERETRLISILLDLPGGTSVPIVASAAEVSAIGERLAEFAEKHGDDPDARISLRQVVREVLGRDPWST